MGLDLFPLSQKVNTRTAPVQKVHTNAVEEARFASVFVASIQDAKVRRRSSFQLQEEDPRAGRTAKGACVSKGEVCVKKGKGVLPEQEEKRRERRDAREKDALKPVKVKVEHESVQKQCVTKGKWIKGNGIEELVIEGPAIVKINVSDSEDEDAAWDDAPVVPGTECVYSHNKYDIYTSTVLQFLANPAEFTLQAAFVYSAGWGDEGCPFQTSFAAVVKDLDERVHKRFPKLEPIHIIMDCRKFEKPQRLSEHFGTHNYPVAQLIHNDHFGPWLKELHKAFKAFENDPAMPNTYAIMC